MGKGRMKGRRFARYCHELFRLETDMGLETIVVC